MSKNRIPYPELINKLEFYRLAKNPYTYERAGHSVTLTSKNGLSYYSHTLGFNGPKEKRLPSNEVYFINKVKRYIENNNLHNDIKPNYKNENDIKYWDYNSELQSGEIFKHGYSVDVSKAYLDAAKKETFLTGELFTEALPLDKRIRLATLGHFAKQTDIWKFDGRIEKHIDTIEPTHPHVFFNQANTIFNIMDCCKTVIGDDFIFYWTDGLYVADKEAAVICEDIIASSGFGFKTTKLKSVIRTNNSFIAEEKGEEPKEYRCNIKNRCDYLNY